MQKRRTKDFNKGEPTPKTPVERTIIDTIDKLKLLVDTSIVVGEKVQAGEFTILPISKVSVGFACGGGEYDKDKSKKVPFAGGTGGGYSISPVGFVVINKSEVTYIKTIKTDAIDKVLEMVPDAINIINKKIDETKKEKDNG